MHLRKLLKEILNLYLVYEEAKNRFWKEGQIIIGFENTVAGVRSLEKVTRCIYHVGLTKEDVYSLFELIEELAITL